MSTFERLLRTRPILNRSMSGWYYVAAAGFNFNSDLVRALSDGKG